MVGKLYGIGVGPGDPELLTLKAARILRGVPVVAVPVTKPDGNSYALDIVSGMLQPERKVLKLLFPMLKDVEAKRGYRRVAAEAISQELVAGTDVAFLTEGDPLFHSTFVYVLNELPANTSVEIVPGISSINAAAAEAQLPLAKADQRLAVIPATFEEDIALRRVLREFDTVVLLKLHRHLDRVLDLLDELDLTDHAVMVERASHANGRVVRDVRKLRGEPVHYLSLLIVHTGGDPTNASCR